MLTKNIIKSIFAFLAILFVWRLFEGKLIELFDNNILPLLSNIEFRKYSNILFFFIILFPINAIYRCIKNKYYIPVLSFLLLSFVVVIYLKYRLFWGYISVPPVISNFGYTDILIFILSIFLVSCFRSFIYCYQKTSTNCIFIPDTPIHEPKLDILDYSESAKQLAKDLETIQVESSCSLGLIAPWGTGKTSYLNLLEYYLDKDSFIIVKFNPRHSYSTHNIQEDFFEKLFSSLKKYDSRFSTSFKSYLKAINIISDSKILPLLLNVHKIWDKESEKEKINHAIRRLNKRVVVIIEDFDRLLSDEIVEVFKLIDGNASFTNLIFISAYDKKLINDIIGNTYSNDNTLFSDKFFTLEIHIPLRPYEKIHNYLLIKLLDNLSVNTEDKEAYQIVLTNHMDILKKHLTTLRDVKRFLNLFTRQFKQVRGEVEFEHYFLLYLIRYSHIDDYLNLYKKEYVETNIIESSNHYFLKNELNTASNEILRILFSEDAKYTLRSINNKAAFHIYFHESIYGGLSIREMNTVFDISLSDAKSFIDKSVLEEKFKDIISFLGSRNILTFETRDIFERFLDLFVYIYCKNYDVSISYSILLKLIYKGYEKQISKKYEYEGQEYKELISSLLKGNFPNYLNNITKGIIIGIIKNELNNEVIFSKEDILQIAKEALYNLIENDNIIKQIHIDLLYSCISDINKETNIVSLDQDACNKVHQLIEENPSGYFDNFVRLGMISSNEDFNSVACEPFWYQLFGNALTFKVFIDGLEESATSKLELIKNFWRLYENNNYRPIEFQNEGNVQEKIDNDLANEVDMLNKILSIESKIEEYKDNINENSCEEDIISHLRRCQELLNQIDNIRLYITKTGDVKRIIETVISTIS